jgi:hypothetical protein
MSSTRLWFWKEWVSGSKEAKNHSSLAYHDVLFPRREIRMVAEPTDINIDSRPHEHIGSRFDVKYWLIHRIVIRNPYSHWYIVRWRPICYGCCPVQAEQELSIAVIVGCEELQSIIESGLIHSSKHKRYLLYVSILGFKDPYICKTASTSLNVLFGSRYYVQYTEFIINGKTEITDTWFYFNALTQRYLRTCCNEVWR